MVGAPRLILSTVWVRTMQAVTLESGTGITPSSPDELRRRDLNPRSSGYEPDEIPTSPPRKESGSTGS